jgi:hypothetical protein
MKRAFDPATMCGAKNRQGNQCTKWKLAGRNRCRNHGGKTHPKGVAKGPIKHGVYAKALPPDEREDYMKRYDAVMADPRKAMLADAVLLQHKVYQLLEKIKNSPDGMLVIEQEVTQKKGTEQGSENNSTEIKAKRVEVTRAVGDALHKASRIIAAAAEVHKVEKEIGLQQQGPIEVVIKSWDATGAEAGDDPTTK